MSLGPDDVATLVRAWGLPAPESIRSPEHGTNNPVRVITAGGRSYVLRIYQNLTPALVAAEHRLLAALAEAGLTFSVPYAIPTPTGATTVATPSGPAALTPYVTGRHPDPADLAAVELAGAALGELDAALAKLSPDLAPTDWRKSIAATHPGVPDLDQLADELAPLLPDRPVDEYLRELAPAVDSTYLRLLDRLPTQLVHGDFALSNVVVDHGRVTGVLDFEVTGFDLRVNDLVTGLVQCGRYWWAPGAEATIAAWCRGYGRHVALRPDELAAIPDLARYRKLGSLVWRAGRWRAGLAGLDELEPRLVDAMTLDRWLARNGDRLLAGVRNALNG